MIITRQLTVITIIVSVLIIYMVLTHIGGFNAGQVNLSMYEEWSPDVEINKKIKVTDVPTGDINSNSNSNLKEVVRSTTKAAKPPEPTLSSEDRPPSETKMKTILKVTLKPTIVTSTIEKLIALPMSRTVSENLAGLRFTKPSNPVILNSAWQVLKDPKMAYLYSAYYDDRESMNGAKVQVLGSFDEKYSGIHCLMWYDNQDNPDVVLAGFNALAQTYLVNGTIMAAYLVTCDTIVEKGAPRQVTLVTPTCTEATTLLDVRIPEKLEKRIQFGLCVPIAYGDHDLIRLVEWLEFLKLLGMGEVNIYNATLGDHFIPVLNSYAEEGFLYKQDLPCISEPKPGIRPTMVKLSMGVAMNDCLYRNIHRYEWISTFDWDEMIVPTKHDNYSDLLATLIKVHSEEKKRAVSFMFRNVYHFTDLGEARNDSQSEYLWMMRYSRHLKPSGAGYAVKSFHRADACVGMQNHYCWIKSHGFYHDKWEIDTSLDYGKMQHYKTCHFDEYLHKPGHCKNISQEFFEDVATLRFKDKLNEMVVPRLHKLNLIKK